MSTAFDLEAFINKAKDPLLQVLFSGGVIRNKKLQKGTILQLNSAPSKDSSNGKTLQQCFYSSYSSVKEFEKKFNSIKQTVYLFKFLFPTPPTQQDRKNACKNFNQFFLKKEETSIDRNESSDIINQNVDSVSDEEQENKYEKPVEPMTHRQQVPGLSLPFGNKAGGQQPIATGQKPAGKVMIPNLNLAQKLKQSDKEEEGPINRGLKVGVDVYNAENKQGGNNKQLSEQMKPTAREDNRPEAGNAGKMKLSLNLAGVKANNNFGGESHRERRDVPSTNHVEINRAVDERQVIDENSDETGRSDETPEKSSSRGDSSPRMGEPVQRRGFQLSNS